MINPLKWFKGPLAQPVLKSKQSPKIEDITYVRGIHERLAAMEVGSLFAVATRTGMHIFQKTSIQPHEQVKSKEK